jgi:hypothetical protein
MLLKPCFLKEKTTARISTNKSTGFNNIVLQGRVLKAEVSTTKSILLFKKILAGF